MIPRRLLSSCFFGVCCIPCVLTAALLPSLHRLHIQLYSAVLKPHICTCEITNPCTTFLLLHMLHIAVCIGSICSRLYMPLIYALYMRPCQVCPYIKPCFNASCGCPYISTHILQIRGQKCNKKDRFNTSVLFRSFCTTFHDTILL